jgi:hypothetical protein
MGISLTQGSGYGVFANESPANTYFQRPIEKVTGYRLAVDAPQIVQSLNTLVLPNAVNQAHRTNIVPSVNRDYNRGEALSLNQTFKRSLDFVRTCFLNNYYKGRLDCSPTMMEEIYSTYNYLELVVDDSARILKYNSGITPQYLNLFRDRLKELEGVDFVNADYAKLLEKAHYYVNFSNKIQSNLNMSRSVHTLTMDRNYRRHKKDPMNPYYASLINEWWDMKRV